MHFTLRMPQGAHEDFEGLSEADLREARVTLPRGLAVNPSAADGRAACSPAQIGLQSAPGARPIAFDEAPAGCPAAAKVGKVEVQTALLDHTLQGDVYLAQQQANPFNSLLALYIALEDPQTGVVVKLAGEVSPDPRSGQLTTTFAENPQVPFEELRFTFFEGPRAALRTPPACGPYTTTTDMVPWSAPEGGAAHPADGFEIAAGPAGPCPSGALAPEARRRPRQPHRQHLQPLLRPPHPPRRLRGIRRPQPHHPLGPDRQAGRHPLLPGGRDRRRSRRTAASARAPRRRPRPPARRPPSWARPRPAPAPVPPPSTPPARST